MKTKVMMSCAVMLSLAAMTCTGGVVSSATSESFAVDARDVKDTTLEGGVIVAGETNLVLQCSANAWGAAVGGDGATVAYSNDTTGATGTIVEKTTAETVGWTPNASGTFVLTHTVATSGDPVVLTATFAVPAQVGDDAWAYVSGGTCTITGTGATWAYDAGNPSALYAYRSAITNLVVQDGITGIGSNFFDGFRTIRNVTLGADCTSVGSQAFLECWRLTNVVSAATTAMNVGAHAFYSCNSLEAMTFGAEPTFGTQAFSMQAGIYMKDGVPEVYPIPQITITGYAQVLKGSNDLNEWVTVTDETKKNYHFFKIVLEPSGN